MSWKLSRTVQCAKCPWRKRTDPNTIPNGYSAEKHSALRGTIATPGDVSALFSRAPIRIMACHEEHEAHCIGWLLNQIGPGNNIALRIRMRDCSNFKDCRAIGPQHETLEDTLPK